MTPAASRRRTPPTVNISPKIPRTTHGDTCPRKRDLPNETGLPGGDCGGNGEGSGGNLGHLSNEAGNRQNQSTNCRKIGIRERNSGSVQGRLLEWNGIKGQPPTLLFLDRTFFLKRSFFLNRTFFPGARKIFLTGYRITQELATLDTSHPDREALFA